MHSATHTNGSLLNSTRQNQKRSIDVMTSFRSLKCVSASIHVGIDRSSLTPPSGQASYLRSSVRALNRVWPTARGFRLVDELRVCELLG